MLWPFWKCDCGSDPCSYRGRPFAWKTGGSGTAPRSPLLVPSRQRQAQILRVVSNTTASFLSPHSLQLGVKARWLTADQPRAEAGRASPKEAGALRPTGNGPGGRQGPAASSHSGADRPGSVGKARQALRTRAARAEPLCSNATCEFIHLLRPARQRADTERSRRPRPLPALGGAGCGPRLPITVSFGRDWPFARLTPAYRKVLLVHWEGGRRRRAAYKGALTPSHPPLGEVTWHFTRRLSPPCL